MLRPLALAMLLTACGANFDAEQMSSVSGAGGGGMTSSQGGQGGGSGGMGAGGDAGSGGAGACVIPLVDDFSSMDFDLSRWAPWGRSSTGMGTLRITWDGTEGQLGGVHSAVEHDLRACSAFIELATPPTTDGVQAFMYIGQDADNRVGFYLFAGTLRFVTRVDGEQDSPGVPFDAAKHRFWRIRESAASVYWDTSPDAIDWTPQHEVPTPPVKLDAGVLNIGAGTQSATNAGEAAFDHFNVVP